MPNGHAPESPGALDVLKNFVQMNSVQLAYVTGRDIRLLQAAVDEFQLPQADFAITDVGSQIYTFDRQWQPLPAWLDKMHSQWPDDAIPSILAQLQQTVGLRLQEEHKQGPFKISFYVDDASQLDNVEQQVQQQLRQCSYPYNVICSIDDIHQVGLLDILPAMANKLQAIQFLIHYVHIPIEHTLFAGDSGNDLSVLISDIPAVLVANAENDLRQQVIKLVQEKHLSHRLYVAQGQYLDFNGNYAAGILEGLWHYAPEYRKLLSQAKS